MAEFTLHYDEEDYFSIDSSISNDYADFSTDNHYAAFPLCVPQDPIEDIELYPKFVDDAISLSGLDSWWKEYETQQQQQQKTRVMLRKRVALQDCNNVFGNKKQRGKREGRRSAWSIASGRFPEAENNEPRQRKCSHCQTTETPQWRIGPLGPKTLCNACGVRYKSGRLLPEYRPAASPTFDSHKHSNFHRKILKKKGCDWIGN